MPPWKKSQPTKTRRANGAHTRNVQHRNDLDAIMKQITDGTPVDPAIFRRIRERAGRVTEEIYRDGDADSQSAPP